MCGRKALKFICSLGIAVFLAGAICTIVGVTKLPTALPDNYYATRPAAASVNITQDLQTYRYQSYGFYLIIIGCSVAGGGVLCCAYTCLVPCCQRTKPKIGAVPAVSAVPSKTARKAVVDVGQPKDKPAPAGAEAETSTTIVRFSEPSPAIKIHSDADPVEQLEDYDGALFYKSTITLPFRFRHSVLINMNNQERITYIKRIHSWLGATAVQYYRVDFD